MPALRAHWSIGSINAQPPGRPRIDRWFRGCKRCFQGHIDLSTSLPSREIVHKRGELGRILPVKASTSLPGPSGSAPVMWAGGRLDQNQRTCGGARRGGNRAVSAQALLPSRWVRMLLITAGSSMQAMIRSAPPQAEQISMSMPKARSRRCDHVIDYRP